MLKPKQIVGVQLFASFIIRSGMYLLKTVLDKQWPMVHSLPSADTLDNNTVLAIQVISNVTLASKGNLLIMETSEIQDQFKGDLDSNMKIIKSLYQQTFGVDQTYGCKIFTTVWHYSLLANYNWILMEGLYLHNIIFMKIFNDNSNILHYIILGWGMLILQTFKFIVDTFCCSSAHTVRGHLDSHAIDV